MNKFRLRRISAATLILGVFIWFIVSHTPITNPTTDESAQTTVVNSSITATDALAKIQIKTKASSDGYSREQFGGGWAEQNGCDTRNIILNRDLSSVKTNDKCQVLSGILNDPYTGKVISFKRGGSTSALVQIDHVVALANAWQTGAQDMSSNERLALANDPLELLAVDGQANQDKSSGDASVWLPPNKSFRCEYVARQVAVKQKYHLWVTRSEHNVIANILDKCSNQALPSP